MDAAQKTYTLNLSRLHCYFVEENEYDDVFHVARVPRIECSHFIVRIAYEDSHK